MIAPEIPATGHHYLALRRRGSRYVATRPRWDEALMTAEDLADEIETRYRTIDAIVEIDGTISHSAVYVSDDEQTAYVLVTSDRRAAAAKHPEPRRDDVHAYLSHLNALVEQTESYPTQCGEHVRHVFVEPHVVEIRYSPELKAQRRPWSDVTRHAYVVVMGEPGMGKTTLLRAMACRYIDEFKNQRDGRIPIYIPLRHFGKNDLLVMRCETALTEAGRPELDFETLASSGRLLVLLDGLDEMPEESRDHFLAQILQFHQQYTLVNLVITSRTASYRGEFKDFRHFQLQPFDDAQCRQWIEWKLEPHESWRTSSRLWEFIAADPHLQEIVRTPLLLAIATFLYKQNDNMPSGRTRMLSRFVEALTGVWDEIRGIARASRHGVNREVRLKHLQRAAYHCSVSGVQEFKTDHYTDWQKQLLESSNASVALQDIAENTGLWSLRSGGQWEFQHPIFQNFLAAKHLVESTDDVMDHVASRLGHADWNDILVFVATLTPDASRFIETICERSDLRREHRARLLSAVLNSEIDVSITAFENAGNHLMEILTQLLRDSVEIAGPLGQAPREWTMTLQFRRGTDESLIQIIRNAIMNLLTGDSSHHRLRLADIFDNSEDETIRHLAHGMRQSGAVVQNLQRSDRPPIFVVNRLLRE